jgi:chromatin modification-related protein VID21
MQDGPSSSTSIRAPQSQINTRKRMASVSSSVMNGSPVQSATFEPRKRRRHALMVDTLRKVVKKREVAQKAAGKSTPVVYTFVCHLTTA